jgi:hypothetical protein
MDIPASVFNVLPVELATEILEGLAWDQACWSRFVEQVLVRTIRVPNPSHQPCEQFVTQCVAQRGLPACHFQNF